MIYKEQGKIVQIDEIEIVGQGLKKRSFVIEVTENGYTKNISFDLFKDRVSKLDDLTTGAIVTVSFAASSREYKGKWYTNLTCINIDLMSENQEPPVNNDNEDIDEELIF